MDDHVEKICPLVGFTQCMKEKCAWWNFLDDECSILTLGTLATIDIGGRDRR